MVWWGWCCTDSVVEHVEHGPVVTATQGYLPILLGVAAAVLLGWCCNSHALLNTAFLWLLSLSSAATRVLGLKVGVVGLVVH